MTENERRQRRAAKIIAQARQTLANRPDYSPPPKRSVPDWPLSLEPEPFEPVPCPPPKLDTRPPSQVDSRAVDVDNRIAAAVAAAHVEMRREMVDALRVVAEEVSAWRNEDAAATDAAWLQSRSNWRPRIARSAI
jgi:hypothetical protein